MFRSEQQGAPRLGRASAGFIVLPARMLDRMGKAVLIAVLLFSQLHLLSIPASAQWALRVSPATIDLLVHRGETVGTLINAANTGDARVTVRVYPMDFRIGKGGAFSFSEPGDESYSCATWLNIDPAEFELLPGETRGVEVAVSVPPEVEPGGHYGALLFETMPGQREMGSPVTSTTRIASLFYVTIPGVTDADVFTGVEIVSVPVPRWVRGAPVELGVVVHNTGNVHLVAAGKAYLTGFWGRKIGEVGLGETVVLPQSERAMRGTWEGTLFLERVKAKVVVGYFDERGELVNEAAMMSFWVVSWQAVGVLGGSIVVCAYLLWRRKRRRGGAVAAVFGPRIRRR